MTANDPFLKPYSSHPHPPQEASSTCRGCCYPWSQQRRPPRPQPRGGQDRHEPRRSGRQAGSREHHRDCYRPRQPVNLSRQTRIKRGKRGLPRCRCQCLGRSWNFLFFLKEFGWKRWKKAGLPLKSKLGRAVIAFKDIRSCGFQFCGGVFSLRGCTYLVVGPFEKRTILCWQD